MQTRTDGGGRVSGGGRESASGRGGAGGITFSNGDARMNGCTKAGTAQADSPPTERRHGHAAENLNAIGV